jgi:hypothetical protein
MLLALRIRSATHQHTEVLEAEKANFESGVPEEIVRVASCGIHFFLQVLISECLTDARQHRRRLAISHVEPTYRDRVLGPSNRARFSHYRSRLKEYYGPLERGAHLILDELALKERSTPADLQSVLARADEPADLEHTLALLESDHYIISDGEEVKFSSGFLRDWWLRNACRSRGRG